MTPEAPNKTIKSSKKNIPTIKIITETIPVKIIEWITALFASSIRCAPTYLEISELAPAPTPLPRPMITKYKGEIKPSAARASELMPATQKLSIRLFKNIKSIEKIVGKANLLIAFLGLPIIDSMFSVFGIANMFSRIILNNFRWTFS